jgi:hypothetical protein
MIEQSNEVWHIARRTQLRHLRQESEYCLLKHVINFGSVLRYCLYVDCIVSNVKAVDE